MNKLTRAFVMSGVAVAAGLTMATAPAVASPSAAAAPATVADKPSVTKGAKSGVTTQVKYRERIHDFYRSPRTCQKVGKIGQFQRKWSRFECDRVFRGFHRGKWALKVSTGWNHGWPHHSNNQGWPHKGNDHQGWPHKGQDWKKR